MFPRLAVIVMKLLRIAVRSLEGSSEKATT